MLIGIIFVIIFLSILILVHELGHFLTAKKFGLWVEEFGFGLPPRLWGKKIGETIYSLNALPFGGFVKIYGEDREDEKISPPTEEISVGQRREKISISGNQLIINEELVMEKISAPDSRSFNSISIGRRTVIIVSGVLMNFLLGWLVLSLIFSIGLPQAVVITEIFPGSPAEKIGLQIGDRIPDVNVDDFVKFTNANRGQKITLKIERNGELKEFSVTPRLNPPSGEGALGIGLVETGLAKQNVLASIWEGLKTSFQIIQMIFLAIFDLFRQLFTIGKVNLEQVAGPVGIVKITAQAGSLGLGYLLQLLALISLNLVVINILPFPALDGGRLLFLLIEKIKGSPLTVKFER
jgi:regulator of sigma E protease